MIYLKYNFLFHTIVPMLFFLLSILLCYMDNYSVYCINKKVLFVQNYILNYYINNIYNNIQHHIYHLNLRKIIFHFISIYYSYLLFPYNIHHQIQNNFRRIQNHISFYD